MSAASDEEMLDRLQSDTFRYFQRQVNNVNGLVSDSTRKGAYCSVAAVGMALSVYPVAIYRGLMAREQGAKLTLAALRFFINAPQNNSPQATGYRGFYYHFLDMESGLRADQSEISTIDTAILLAGALAAANYFQDDNERECEIRELADQLYRRTDWQWALNGGKTVTHGWMPESGFLGYRWKGYNEALFLYILGLGSPTSPLPTASYAEFTAGYHAHWKEIYGKESLYAGSLFIHQMPQIWIDFREIQDEFMRARGLDYFQNSRMATEIQREYAMRNPYRFKLYGEHCWGFTASEGPGPDARQIDGIDRYFFGYEQRGAPFGPDDGTIAPWAAVASLPFAPEVVLPTIRNLEQLKIEALRTREYGFRATFNATYEPDDAKDALDVDGINRPIWVDPYYYGLNQGPIILMIENYRSGLLWNILRRCPYIQKGLRRAGFRGGWLDQVEE